MYFNRKCKITFISHGATIYSEEHKFSDKENYPELSEFGLDEMERVCKYLKCKGVKNDAIYTSPSVRTVQCAKLISKLYKKDYITLDGLTPRKCGILNGMTIEQIEKENLSLLEKWYTKVDYDEELQAESISDFVKRVNNVVNAIVEENNGNRIIIVTHPDVIQAVVCSVLGMPLDKISRIFIRTGSTTQISYFDDSQSLIYSDYVPLF